MLTPNFVLKVMNIFEGVLFLPLLLLLLSLSRFNSVGLPSVCLYQRGTTSRFCFLVRAQKGGLIW